MIYGLLIGDSSRNADDLRRSLSRSSTNSAGTDTVPLDSREAGLRW